MSEKEFLPIRRRERDQIVAALECSSAPDIAEALLSAAYWDDDWRWAQDVLLKFSAHESEDVLWAVATGLGFLAAFHGQIDLQLVEPVLKEMGTDAAAEALADIEHFVRNRQAGQDVDLAERLPEDWRP